MAALIPSASAGSVRCPCIPAMKSGSTGNTTTWDASTALKGTLISMSCGPTAEHPRSSWPNRSPKSSRKSAISLKTLTNIASVSTPGIGVVARAVIAGEQRDTADPVAAAVPERMRRQRGRRARAPSTDARWRRATAPPRVWESCAIVGIRNCRQVVISAPTRLVLRRHAAHRIGDRRADQLQPVVGPRLETARGEAEADQRAVEQVAGIVAGERPAGAVGAAQAGRQADDQQPHASRPRAAGRSAPAR